jgi:DNA-binding MarR family transcriptional regulator
MAEFKKGGVGTGIRLRLAHIAFSRALRFELGQEGFSFGQFVHLDRLWDQDGLTQAALSRAVGVEVASSTTIIAELEALGLIQRVRSDEDRRKIHVFLTPAGAALEGVLRGAARRVNKTARGALSDDEMTLLFSLLETVAANVNARYPGGADRRFLV